KTKFKPSHLLDIAAGTVGIAGAASAFIPGVDLISVPAAAAASLGLKSVAHLARTSGRGIPKKHMRYIDKNPDFAKYIAQQAKKKKQVGMGKASTFLGAMGIAGTSAAAGAYGLYQYLLQNPGIAAKLAAKGGAKAASAWLAGKGVNVAGSGTRLAGSGQPGITYSATGKMKRDRYSVYYGHYPSTYGGLRKEDFLKKGRKIISKKKHEAGLKAAKNLIR
ncbi:MAG: hypothetical protein GY804_03530, partial [Alphaproteobacteria bacterium]|nr:hypothetical protein [Alphaproteobacteria bacterium]